MGKTEKDIIQLAKQTNSPLPESIKNKPQLLAGLGFIWSAFWDLCPDRSIGMAEGPIWWSSVNSYCRRHNIYGYEFDRFTSLIKIMDETYIQYRTDEQQKNVKKKNKKPIKNSGI